MKKFLILFLTFILFFSVPLSVFASESDTESEEPSWEEIVIGALATAGYVLEDGFEDIPLGESFGECLYALAYIANPELTAEYDAAFGEGNLSELYYNQQLLQILYDENYISVSNEGSLLLSEDVINSLCDALEDSLSYKVCYTISCYDVSSANWTNIAQWNVMTNAASAKLDGDSDNQSFLNPDVPVDSQVYAVGRNTAAGQLLFANVSGLSFVCTSSSQFQSVLDCNFKGTGFDYSIGRVNFYDASGATASVEQYDFFYPYDSALKYNSKISSWTIRYRNNDGGYYFNYFVDGGTERLPILFFENVQALNEYISGQSPVYQIPSDYQGGDMVVNTNIDYRELYDAISAAIATGEYLTATEIQKAVEEAASEYLDRIAQNTADVNDALRDQEGNSWLRRISGTLDDLAEGFQEYSTSMLSEIKSGFAWIKTELAAILAVGVVDLVWEDVQADISNAVDIAQALKDLAKSKFPFSIPSDIGFFFNMLRAEPIEPIFEIPLNFMGEETIVVLDLTFAEDFIPYVHAGFILVFIAGLFGVSIKLISIMSGGV